MMIQQGKFCSPTSRQQTNQPPITQYPVSESLIYQPSTIHYTLHAKRQFDNCIIRWCISVIYHLLRIEGMGSTNGTYNGIAPVRIL